MNTKYLVKKYGQQILEDFDDLFIRQFWNLSDLAKKYGFSRERARQIFKKLYGYGYRLVRTEKILQRKQEYNLCSLYLSPRIALFLIKLVEKQLEITNMSNEKYKINGHFVRFSQPSAVDYGPYNIKHFRIGLVNDNFDFCIVNTADLFYIIPKSEFTFEPALNRLVLYIRATAYSMTNKGRCGKRPRDLERYKEAWHLLDVKRAENL